MMFNEFCGSRGEGAAARQGGSPGASAQSCAGSCAHYSGATGGCESIPDEAVGLRSASVGRDYGEPHACLVCDLWTDLLGGDTENSTAQQRPDPIGPIISCESGCFSQSSAEHLQQFTKLAALRHGPLGPLAMAVLPIPFARGAAATAGVVCYRIALWGHMHLI
jgi:hypothetical protein